MNASDNNQFYITYAGVACKIVAPKEWGKYFRKLYEKSSIVQYSDTPLSATHTALLTVLVIRTRDIRLTCMSEKNLTRHTIKASDTPIFLFPTVHQFICRILNIMFHRSGGFVLHASSVHSRGRTFIFAGMSGRGKSTIVDIIARKHPGTLILSDNSAFIRKHNGRFLLYPSPYIEPNRLAMLQTKFRPAPPYEIDAVYFPFHAKKNSVSDLTIHDKISLIQLNSHIPGTPEKLFSTSESNTFAKNVFSFIHKVPIRKLEFVKSSAFLYNIFDYEQ